MKRAAGSFVAVFLAMAGLLPTMAVASPPLTTGIVEPEFRSSDQLVRQELLAEARSAGAELAMTYVSWRAAAPAQPGPDFDASDPADPAYDWGTIDDMVRDADAQGFDLVMLVTEAPDWAEGPNRPPKATVGTWKPDPSALAQFATAIASRYSGGFTDPASPDSAPLPRVDYFQAWAEANLATRLSPQWSGKRRAGHLLPRSPEIYRELLNAFYPAIKRVDPSMQVITTGTAPYGDLPGGRRVRPLEFWRNVLCLKSSGLEPSACPEKARFDILAHHPINTLGAPTKPPVDPDDISSANLGDLVSVLRSAERARLVAPYGRHPVWVTEFWYRSNPPEVKLGVSPGKQARYIALSLYLFWDAGAEAAVNLYVQDAPGPGDSFTDPSGSGLYFSDGRPKPAETAFRFPFVVRRLEGKTIRIWGKAPRQGMVVIEARKAGGWRPVARLRAGKSRIFTAEDHIGGRMPMRAVIGEDASLPFRP